MAEYIDRQQIEDYLKINADILFKSDFEIKGFLNTLYSIPIADVVPRSEYDAVVSAVDNSTKEFLKLHDAYQNQKREFEAELDKGKQEFAWEIISEFKNMVINYVKDRDLLLVAFKNAVAYVEAELKKKYIGE